MTAPGVIVGSRETEAGLVVCHICVSAFLVLALSVSLLVTFDIVSSHILLTLLSPRRPVTHKIPLYSTTLLYQRCFGGVVIAPRIIVRRLG